MKYVNKILDWVMDNRVLASVIISLALLLILILMLRGGGRSDSLRGLDRQLKQDVEVAQNIISQQEEQQEQIQEDLGMTIQIPTKEEINDAIIEEFGEDPPYNTDAVQYYVGELYGWDVQQLYHTNKLPEEELSPMEQAALNIYILRQYNTGNYTQAADPLIKVESGIKYTNTYPKYNGMYIYEDGEKEILDFSQNVYRGNEQYDAAMYMNDTTTHIETDKLIIRNPMVHRTTHYEGIPEEYQAHQPGISLSVGFIVSPKEPMNLDEYKQAILDLDLSIQGVEVAIPEEALVNTSMDYPYEQPLNEIMIHPVQGDFIAELPVLGTTDTSRNYIELNIGKQTVILQRANEYTKAVVM